MNGIRSRPNILIVDDDPDLRQILSAILTVEGYRVAVAESGAEALGVIEGGPTPALILLDLRMPGMSGEELKAKLDADPRWVGIPTLVLSGDADAVRVASAIGACGVIQKPVELQPLLQQIARAAAEAMARSAKTAA